MKLDHILQKYKPIQIQVLASGMTEAIIQIDNFVFWYEGFLAHGHLEKAIERRIEFKRDAFSWMTPDEKWQCFEVHIDLFKIVQVREISEGLSPVKKAEDITQMVQRLIKENFGPHNYSE